MTDKIITTALKIDRALARQYADYLESVEADYREGFRAHYCEHGVNMWVDYDAICGSCEDGRTSSDPVQRRRTALALSREYWQDIALLVNTYSSLPTSYRQHFKVDAALTDLHQRWQWAIA